MIFLSILFFYAFIATALALLLSGRDNWRKKILVSMCWPLIGAFGILAWLLNEAETLLDLETVFKEEDK